MLVRDLCCERGTTLCKARNGRIRAYAASPSLTNSRWSGPPAGKQITRLQAVLQAVDGRNSRGDTAARRESLLFSDFRF